MVVPGLVDSISTETVRQALKKTTSGPGSSINSPLRSHRASPSPRGRVKKNDLPTSTAYRWAKDPDVRRNGGEDRRRRSLHRALGPVARRTTWAVNTITKLIEGAESESVQLRAARAVLSDPRRHRSFPNAPATLSPRTPLSFHSRPGWETGSTLRLGDPSGDDPYCCKRGGNPCNRGRG